MKIAAHLRLKNAPIFLFRQKRGWTQPQLAEFCGVSSAVIWNLENLRFGSVSAQTIERIATAIGSMPEELVPEELRGKILPNEMTKIVDVSPSMLASGEIFGVKALPSPAEALEEQELKNIAEQAMQKVQQWSSRTHFVLIERSKGRTYGEIGKDLKLTRERVRQIEARGMKMARRFASELLGRE